LEDIHLHVGPKAKRKSHKKVKKSSTKALLHEAGVRGPQGPRVNKGERQK